MVPSCVREPEQRRLGSFFENLGTGAVVNLISEAAPAYEREAGENAQDTFTRI